MQAVGTYFDRLIALRGLKVKTVSEQANVKPGYVSRLKSQDIKEPAASTLKAVNDAVGGSWDDVGVLLDARATIEQAEALAEACYSRLKKMSDLDRDALRRRLLAATRSLLSDDDQLDQLLRQP